MISFDCYAWRIILGTTIDKMTKSVGPFQTEAEAIAELNARGFELKEGWFILAPLEVGGEWSKLGFASAK